MRTAIPIILLNAALACAVVPATAAELKVGANDTVQSVLAAAKGSRATVRLRSGQELTGVVRALNIEDAPGKVMPMDSASPNSRLIVAVSNVSACHISNWLMAVLGIKSAPRSQPTLAYHCVASSFDQTSRTADTDTVVSLCVSLF